MKKYKLHKRKKTKGTKLVLITFAMSTFFVSYGYSALADTLTLAGTANVKYEQNVEQDISEIYEPIVECSNYLNSTYTYENLSNWIQGDGAYIYEVKLSITNMDKDYSNGSLEISFDEKQGLAKEQSKENLGILQAEKVLINGNRITVLLSEISSQIKYGEKIEINAYITYEKEQKDGITLENVTLNGNKLVKEDQKSKIENSNIEKNEESNNTEKIKEKTVIKEEPVVKEEPKTNIVIENIKDNISNDEIKQTEKNINEVENTIETKEIVDIENQI